MIDNAIVNEMDAFISEFDELKKTFKEKASEKFKIVFKDFFDKNPGISAVLWRQYTPYFADGDPCVFNVHGVMFTNATPEELDDISPYEDDYEEGESDVWLCDYSIKYHLERFPNRELTRRILKSNPDVDYCEYISTLIESNSMRDILLAMFDDHVEVTATRDGFAVEEFYHDQVNVVSLIDFAKSELDIIGMTENSDELDSLMRSNILDIITKFAEQGHSGFSANYAVTILGKLLNYEPLTPLTGEDSEWSDVAIHNGGNILYQNKRCSRIFKDESGSYDIDGKVFVETWVDENGENHSAHFVNKDSRVYIEFPYTPKTEFVERERDQ